MAGGGGKGEATMRIAFGVGSRFRGGGTTSAQHRSGARGRCPVRWNADRSSSEASQPTAGVHLEVPAADVRGAANSRVNPGQFGGQVRNDGVLTGAIWAASA